MVLRQCVRQHLGLQYSIQTRCHTNNSPNPCPAELRNSLWFIGSEGTGRQPYHGTFMVHLYTFYHAVNGSTIQYHACIQQHFLDAVFLCVTYIHVHVFLLAYFKYKKVLVNLSKICVLWSTCRVVKHINNSETDVQNWHHFRFL